MTAKRRLLLFLPVLLLTLTVRAQPMRARLADTAWQRLTAPPAYPYRNAIESVAPPARPADVSPLIRILWGLFSWLGSTPGQILLWSLFCGIVLWAVYRLVTGRGKFSFRRSQAAEAAAPEALPDEAVEGDWALLAKEAATAGDYRLAMRYGYRLLLDRLAGAGHIRFEARKSDAEYLRELQLTPHAAAFRPLLRQYERAWFGGYAVEATAYQAFHAPLQQLLNDLSA